MSRTIISRSNGSNRTHVFAPHTTSQRPRSATCHAISVLQVCAYACVSVLAYMCAPKGVSVCVHLPLSGCLCVFIRRKYTRPHVAPAPPPPAHTLSIPHALTHTCALSLTNLYPSVALLRSKQASKAPKTQEALILECQLHSGHI